MRDRVGAALAALERLADRPRGAALLFGVALGVYALVSVGVPLHDGRDIGTYLRYYSQFFDGEPALPMSMLFRGPIASLLVGGSLDLFGGFGAQVLMAVLYAAATVAWAGAARAFGPRVAVLTALALLAYPSWALLFHSLASDAVSAAGFAGFALLLSRAYVAPSVGRWALVGFGAGLLALIRPGNQILLVVGLVPLLLGLAWRARVAAVAACLVSGALVLGGWSIHNGVRYGDYAVARGGNAFFPFYRTFAVDRIVRPENGPASAELAAAVERELIGQEPYAGYGIDLETFFRSGSPRLWEDAVTLSDRVWGWDTDYEQLRSVGFEAVRSHPGAYLGGVATTVLTELRTVMTYEPLTPPADVVPDADGRGSVALPDPPSGLPAPSEGELVPSARQSFFTTTPDGSLREVWTSPVDHRLVSTDPSFAARQRQMDEDDGRLRAELPPYEGSDLVRRAVNLASRVYPRPGVWLFVGLVALVWRRPRRAGLALLLTAAATAVIGLSAMGIYAIFEFALAVIPAFMLLAVVGLVGERARPLGRRAGSVSRPG